MTKFVTNDNETFEAANAKDLVKQMAATSFGATDKGISEYMRDVASRAEVAASVTLRTENCDAFVSDMLIHGLLKSEG